MWLLFALMAPLFWAVVHILDEHCVDHILEKPWMGITTSAFASSIFYLFLPFILFFTGWQTPSLSLILLALGIGVLIQISQFFYFTSLSFSEAGIVATYWNIVPAILPIASFFIYGQILDFNKYFGIAILIFASTWICFLDIEHKNRFKSLFLMILASLILSTAFLLEFTLYNEVQFITGFTFITTGIILAGLVPLFFSSLRTTLKKNFHILNKEKNKFVIIEVLNLIALLFSQLAISYGIPSLVSAVQTIIPAYTFIFSLFLIKRTQRFGAPNTRYKIKLKLLNVILIVIGVFLVS